VSGEAVGLLVSVRSVQEARAAIEGGCAVLDVKEPAHGPLGMADPAVIREAVECGRAAGVATSMALGEVVDWTDEGAAGWDGPSVDFAKLGLSGMSQVDWTARWQEVRGRLRGVGDWIAVAYADASGCDAPVVEDVVAAAIGSGCAGVLVDTWDKSRGRLVDHLSVKQLESIRSSTREAGLLLALAGRVSIADLPGVAAIGPDLVAVRSAACRDGRRELAVETDRVRELVACLEVASGPAVEWRNAG
jgi:uncharacterized protein (UPF0264 family)